MTTAQILALVRAKILEEEDDIINDDTLLIYANLAYKDVIKRTFPSNSILTATVSFTNGVGAFPSLFGTLYTDALDANGNVFPELSIADFARNNSGNAITVEGGTLKVLPTTTASLVVKYYPTYPTLNTSTPVNPTIDEFLHEPIVYGTIYRAFEDLQDFELAQFYEAKFTNMLSEKLSALSNYEETAQKGGAMFNGINIIGGGSASDPNHW